jgi:hypothetical protein
LFQPCLIICLILSYERIKTDETEMKLISSLHRKEIIKNTKQPENKMGLLNLASDESDQDYPIYRTPRSSDHSLTTATGKKKL